MDFIKKCVLFVVTPSLLSCTTAALIGIGYLLHKYISIIFRRDPRLVEFAATLPGPPTVPILGNGLDFYLAGSHIMNKIVEYSEKYGSVYRIWIGKHLLVGLKDPADFEVVFNSSKMLGRGEISKPFEDFGGNGIFCAETPTWKKNRKRLQLALANDMLPHYVPSMQQKIDAVVNEMKMLIDGPVFDVWDHLPHLSFDIVTKAMLDVDLNSRTKSALQFHQLVQIVLESSFLRMFRPWLQIKFLDDLLWKKQLTSIKTSLLEFSKGIATSKVKEMKQKMANHNQNGTYESDELLKKRFLYLAYHIGQEANNELFMHDEIITMIIAGTDTSAITNASFLLAVAMYPDIQDKLYDELFEIFGDGDRPADQDDLARLPYLDQVLKETMRRFTLLPVIFRQVDEDTKIGSRIFPAGTHLMLSFIGVHWNPKFYPNPWEFNPENFAPDAVVERHKLMFLPFSAGPRNCIGQNFAILEGKLTLIALLRTFCFHTDVKMEDIKLALGFITINEGGYKMRVTKRDRRPSYIRKQKN